VLVLVVLLRELRVCEMRGRACLGSAGGLSRICCCGSRESKGAPEPVMGRARRRLVFAGLDVGGECGGLWHVGRACLGSVRGG
jgi:hypothetical protein